MAGIHGSLYSQSTTQLERQPPKRGTNRWCGYTELLRVQLQHKILVLGTNKKYSKETGKAHTRVLVEQVKDKCWGGVKTYLQIAALKLAISDYKNK